MSTLLTLPRRFLKDEEGAALVEYGMLVVLIALAAVLAVTNLGTKVKDIFTGADNKLPNPTTP